MMSTLFDKTLRWTGVAAAPLVMAITVTTLSPTQAQAQGAAAANVIEVTGTVAVIDKEKRILTLVTEDGAEVQKEVAPDIAAFDTLNVGDTIAVRISRMLAVEVDRPETQRTHQGRALGQ